MLIGACLVIAPVVWVFQMAVWLKDGYWKSLPLAVITGYMSGSSWVGWESIVNWVADLNLGAVLILVARGLYWVGKPKSA